MPADPHAQTPTLAAGTPLSRARAAVVLIHGRGAGARGILPLARAVGTREIAWLAPEASGSTWYPYSFLAPVEDNEPHLGSALARIAAEVEGVRAAGIAPGRTALVGFSQGACLACQFVATQPAAWGGLVAFSGGLIGPPGTAFAWPGDLAGTPVFLGCGDRDAHIPRTRVEETAKALAAMGAAVDRRIYPGMDHRINDDELDALRARIEALAR